MKDKIPQFIWPTLEEMKVNKGSGYCGLQIEFENRIHYIIAESQRDVVPHPYTISLTTERNISVDKEGLLGHAATLDVFIRKLVSAGLDPERIDSIGGFDCEHRIIVDNRIIPFYVDKISGRFSELDIDLLMKDLQGNCPDYLELRFGYEKHEIDKLFGKTPT